MFPRAGKAVLAVALTALAASAGGHAAEGDAYGWWNDFCIEHFGAEKEPLVYGLYGSKMKVPAEGVWRHVSANSAAIAWETTLPAKTWVEYGPTADYGSKTAEPERHFYVHLHYLKGLKPDATCHYRLVSVDERGNRVTSEDMTLTTKAPAGAVMLPGNMAGPPYRLGGSGTTYVLTKDVTAPGVAFEMSGSKVTLDLNGHTVTFGAGATGPVSGGVSASRGSSGLRLLNGIIAQGRSPGANANKNSLAFNCYRLDGADVEVAGITVDYHAPQAWGALIDHPSGKVNLHHNVFVDRGTKIVNRHGKAVRSFGFLNRARKRNDFRIEYNLIKRSRQNGISGAFHMAHNEIHIDSFSTNSFALQPMSVPNEVAGELHHNRVFATGFNPYGTGWAHLDLMVHDNLVHMHGIDAKQRWHERWGDVSTLEGFRVTNYGKGGQVRKNLKYWNNVLVLKGVGGSELRGTGFFSDTSISDLVFHDNTVKAVSLDEKTRQVAAVSCHGHYKKADTCLPVYYRDNTLISNVCNVRFGDSYGKGSNHHFIGCKLVRVGDNPRYHTIAFGGAYWCKRNVLQDCEFEGGARYDDVFWQKTGKPSFYDVRWTLSLEVPQGAKIEVADSTGAAVDTTSAKRDEDGTVKIVLDQCRIVPPDGFRGGQPNTSHKKTMKTPHTVTVSAGGKTATAKVEMTKKRFFRLKGAALVEYDPAAAVKETATARGNGASPKAARAAGSGNGNGTAKAAKLYRSARSAERAGMKDLAKTLYERLVKEYPDSPLAEKAQKRLK